MDSHCEINCGSEKSYNCLIYQVQACGDWDEKALRCYRLSHLVIFCFQVGKGLSWPKSSFRFFRYIIWKTLKELFGQSNRLKHQNKTQSRHEGHMPRRAQPQLKHGSGPPHFILCSALLYIQTSTLVSFSRWIFFLYIYILWKHS